MVTKKITPVNPDTKENDDAKTKDAEVDRKTAMCRGRKSARKTAMCR